jgi:transposase-like protein
MGTIGKRYTERAPETGVAELALLFVPALSSATVPWRCPACQLPIHHNELEAMPRPGERYRCHVCRLELVMDLTTRRLMIQ